MREYIEWGDVKKVKGVRRSRKLEESRLWEGKVQITREVNWYETGYKIGKVRFLQVEKKLYFTLGGT